MLYLLTWSEGGEVGYLFVPDLNIDKTLLEGKNLIITKLDQEKCEEEKTYQH